MRKKLRQKFQDASRKRDIRKTNDRLRILEENKGISMYSGVEDGSGDGARNITEYDLLRDNAGNLYNRNTDNSAWQSVGGGGAVSIEAYKVSLSGDLPTPTSIIAIGFVTTAGSGYGFWIWVSNTGWIPINYYAEYTP